MEESSPVSPSTESEGILSFLYSFTAVVNTMSVMSRTIISGKSTYGGREIITFNYEDNVQYHHYSI